MIKAAGKTEEPRKESDKTASVKTGDKTDPAVYIFFVILTGGMIAILSAGNRKNRRNRIDENRIKENRTEENRNNEKARGPFH